jgi:hypothetical protein
VIVNDCDPEKCTTYRSRSPQPPLGQLGPHPGLGGLFPGRTGRFELRALLGVGDVLLAKIPKNLLQAIFPPVGGSGGTDGGGVGRCGRCGRTATGAYKATYKGQSRMLMSSKGSESKTSQDWGKSGCDEHERSKGRKY